MTDAENAKPYAGWRMVPFGRAVRNIAERVEPAAEDSELYVGLEHLEADSLTVRRWGSERELEGTKLRMRKGDVLFAKRNAYLRRVALAPHDGLFSAHGMVLRANPDLMLHEFLPFFMQSDRFMGRAIQISVGSLSPTINWATLAAEEFVLPPIEEQRRMAEVLEVAEQLIEQIKTAAASVQIVEIALNAELVANPKHERSKVGEFARFSSGEGITVSELPKDPDPEHTVPVIGGNGVAAYSRDALSKIPDPAVVIGRVGEYCGAVHYITGPCWISDNALYVRELSARVDSRYLTACLRGLNLNRLSVGGAQPLLNQRILGELQLPIPPISTQHEIVARLLELEGSLVSLGTRLEGARRIKARFLQEVLEARA